MRTHIVFIICTGEALAMYHRERELIQRAESIGVVLAPRHLDDSFDTPRPRVSVGTIGHIDWGRHALALALKNSSRFVLPLPELKITAVSYGKAKWGHQFAKIRKQHEQDFQRKSKQHKQAMRNSNRRRK
ncbi:MAG: hypothetical protein A2937_02525 [Candidatus Yonathbacteria bacterium RIFCSPLOWO2_01_FULL_47_33b]|uniref:Uncharacterized protein n=1 Tax=Candidatus Yonathbacteria bacterium RIFCSPLOWO2_01_FULL_47_33b TaxID=1802727 RepID=A0A1G2SGB3_9BACT|nr:MAG: hypothetical protein A2937_02525 [Candidatus Yonathbacteria bacterium RIFCSPLOWO2_01_FULL_47_33b]